MRIHRIPAGELWLQFDPSAIFPLRRLNKMLGFEDQTQTEEVYLTIRRLKRAKCLEQRQAVGINHDILVKIIDAQPDRSRARATAP